MTTERSTSAESVAPPGGDAALRAVFADQFGRIQELSEGLTADLSAAVTTWRPGPDANTIGWLLWHTARVADAQIADLAGTEQVWTAQGFVRRFGLPFDTAASGYGQTPEQVGQVAVTADRLAGYQRAVHAATLGYVATLTAEEVDRVVDTRWDPPVTAGVRLVSIVGDCLQHLGQAAYVRGMARRAGIG